MIKDAREFMLNYYFKISQNRFLREKRKFKFLKIALDNVFESH